MGSKEIGKHTRLRDEVTGITRKANGPNASVKKKPTMPLLPNPSAVKPCPNNCACRGVLVIAKEGNYRNGVKEK